MNENRLLTFFKKNTPGMDELCAFVLSVTLSVTAMSLYGDGIFRAIVLCAALCLINLVICAVVNRYRFAGFFITIAYLFGYFALMLRFINAGERETGVYFWQWMVSGGDASTLEIEAGADGMLKLGMYMAVSVFFMITVFYFSVPMYRFGYLSLISLMPFVLYAKVTSEVENKYLVVVIIASLLLHLVCARKVSPTRAEYKQAKKESTIFKHREPARSNDWKIKLKGKGTFILGFALLSAVVLIASAAVPKRKSARFYDRFEDLFLGGDTESEVGEDFSGLADFSGNADNFRGGSNRRLYMVTGDGSIYLKRQVFDLYDFKRNRWYAMEGEDAPIETDGWLSDQKLYSVTWFMKTLRAVEALNPGFAEKYGLESFISGELIYENTGRYNITAQNFGAAYYLSAAGIAGISLPEGEEYLGTERGTFYRREGIHDKDLSYRIEVYDRDAALAGFNARGGMNMSAKESLDMFNEINSILVSAYREAGNTGTEIEAFVKDSAGKETEITKLELINFVRAASVFLNEQLRASAYRDRVAGAQGEIPTEIQELSEELTGSLEYDWQKADVLERYFRENDFLYDLEYRAPDDSPSYFLFEGKTGTCSDFASAFVLLARAAGLTVRYTEGFVPDDTYGDMYMVVTESDSHAYAEVFIQNAGWIVFDPTAGVRSAENGGFFEFLRSLNVDFGLIRVIALAAVFIAGLVIIIRFVIPFAAELVFRISLRFMAPEKALVKAYLRLLRKGRRSGAFTREEIRNSKASAGGVRYFEPTPGELADIVSRRGVDITEFITLLEKARYGSDRLQDKEPVITSSYARASRALRRKKRVP